MPEYNPLAVIEAFRENLISREEARDFLGFTDPEDATPYADEVVRLEVEVARLKEQLESEKAHALAEFSRGFECGLRGSLRAGAVSELTRYFPPNIYPTRPDRTFTVSNTGETVSTPT